MIGKNSKKNNPTIAPDILYTKEKKILPAYISNHNSINNSINDSKQIKKEWYFLS